MKQIYVLVLFLILFSTPAKAEWSVSQATNPLAGDVIVQATATAPQWTSFCVNAYASIAATFHVQHRDAANTGTLKEHYLGVLGGTNGQFCTAGVLLAANERIRITMDATILGTVSVSLLHGIY